MNKLSKPQAARHNETSSKLTTAHDTLTRAIEEYNEARTEAFAKVTTALEALNTELNAARELRDEVVSDMESYTGERSEKWAESDAAQDFGSWQDAWEGMELDDVEIDEPEELDTPEVDVESFEQEIRLTAHTPKPYIKRSRVSRDSIKPPQGSAQATLGFFLHERIRVALGWKTLEEVRSFNFRTLRDLVHMSQHAKLAAEITDIINSGEALRVDR